MATEMVISAALIRDVAHNGRESLGCSFHVFLQILRCSLLLLMCSFSYSFNYANFSGYATGYLTDRVWCLTIGIHSYVFNISKSTVSTKLHNKAKQTLYK